MSNQLRQKLQLLMQPEIERMKVRARELYIGLPDPPHVAIGVTHPCRVTLLIREPDFMLHCPRMPSGLSPEQEQEFAHHEVPFWNERRHAWYDAIDHIKDTIEKEFDLLIFRFQTLPSDIFDMGKFFEESDFLC